MRPKTRLKDLARRAGVSISTVSRALSDSPLVSEDTKTLIRRLEREHRVSGMLSKQASEAGLTTLSVVVPPPQGHQNQITETFHLELIGGLADACREKNCDLLISRAAVDDEQALADLLKMGRADGLIILGQGDYHAELNRLADKNFPFVVWGAKVEGQRYVSVGSDNRRGGQRATEHLIRLGARRIVFLGEPEALEVAQRFAGYRTALDRSGIDFDPALAQTTQFYFHSAAETINALLDDMIAFDGVFASSDVLALGAVKALLDRGRSVPRDIPVIGYDDIPVSAYYRPSLSTIRQDTLQAGRIMINKLLRVMAGERVASEVMETALIIRESCGA